VLLGLKRHFFSVHCSFLSPTIRQAEWHSLIVKYIAILLGGFDSTSVQKRFSRFGVWHFRTFAWFQKLNCS